MNKIIVIIVAMSTLIVAGVTFLSHREHKSDY